MKDYLALTKPRITWLILMSTGIGYFFGSKGGWHFLTLFHTLLGNWFARFGNGDAQSVV